MRPVAIAIAAVFAIAVPVAAHAQHHDSPHAHPAAPSLPPAQPWPADATLSANMAQIHEALEQLQHAVAGHMDQTLALDRVGVIEASASEIFTKCELPPERDAVLHGMLVPLLAAAQKFRAAPEDTHQLVAMRDAVAAYPRYFEAPGWDAPRAR